MTRRRFAARARHALAAIADDANLAQRVAGALDFYGR